MAYLDYNGLSRFKDKVFQVLLSKFSNPNLLINSNFAINQRGASSYTASNVYTVDRWKKGSGTVTVNSNYLTLSVGCDISQYFEATPFADQTLTATINVNGTLVSKSFTFVSTNSNTVIQLFANGWRLEYSGGSKYFRIVNVSGSASDKLYWSKLEIGDISTIYNPPAMAEELTKCQRYYQVIKGYTAIATGMTTSTTDFRVPLILTNEMRVHPTATLANGYLFGGDQYWNFVNLSSATFDGQSNNAIQIIGTLSTAVSAWSTYMLILDINGYLEFDAEIY